MRMRGRFIRGLPNAFGVLGAVVLAGGSFLVAASPNASAAKAAAFTANDYFGGTGHNVVGTLTGTRTRSTATGAFAGCKNGKPTAINCNLYPNKNAAWMNSGPVAQALTTGTYFFAVVAPSSQDTPNDSKANTKNLSFKTGDPWTNREFTVHNGVVTYSGTHGFDTTINRIQLMPYTTTPNPGGVYALDICRVPSTIVQGTGAPGANSNTCKKDNFKVAAAGLNLPSLTTSASGPVTVGTSIHDTATLSGGNDPTGTITFKLYSTSSCSNLVDTAATAVNGDGSYTSANFTPATAGTYYWVASYSGDTRNEALTSACDIAGESSTVNKASPTLVTHASGPVTVGTSIHDTATLSGGHAPTGTITFKLYSTSSCRNQVMSFSTPGVAVDGNGNYTSAMFTPKRTGTYYWIASYSGDANNAAVTGTCCQETEESVVTKATPGLATHAVGSVTLGSPIHDTATLSGGYDPTGTITFALFTTEFCGTSARGFTTKGVTVSGDGNYTSAVFTPTRQGTYYWLAKYSGDVNNKAVVGTCNAATETTTVGKAGPTISTVASGPVAVGAPIHDTALLSGGDTPTGTITFKLFSTSACKTAVTGFSTTGVSVNGDGTYRSASITPTAGTYYWVADYSGDANNKAVTSPCGAPTESSTVLKATPGLSTYASGPVTVGASIHDTADLSGGYTPTGTITFKLYSTDACKTLVATGRTPVHGDGTYRSFRYTPATAGTYYWVADYSGDVNNNPVTSPCGAPTESSKVNKATPTLTTKASGPVTVGSPIHDTATLSGGHAPTGTITFQLFSTSSCSTAVSTFSTTGVAVSGDGNYSSATFTTTKAGTYYWIASYSGDVNNKAVTSPCGAPTESSTVTKGSPKLTTHASGPVTVGSPIHDTATLAGGHTPTGSITFQLFSTSSCSTAVTGFSTTGVAVHGDGTYTSASATVTAGTYYWVASYSGDASNKAVTSPCGAATESSTVMKATPGLTTHASGPVTVGSPIHDTATLSGGHTATGTITFSLYRTTACATPVSSFVTAGDAVHGPGNYPSATYTATAKGTYYWVASYSGDANNNAVTSPCNADTESSTVGKATPAIATKATGPVTVGMAIRDTATLSGGSNPTGTITFKVYSTDTCATLVGTVRKSVNGDGTYTSPPFTPTAAGTYYWVARYSGDANNNAVHGTCGAPTEESRVTKATAALTTKAASPVTVGASIHDTATLSGGYAPSGTITFTLFTTDACRTAATGFSTAGVTVSGDGTYTSAMFTTTTAGTYYWVASYSGDKNNSPVTSPCGAPTESSKVRKATPALTTKASGPVTVGTPIHDTATLADGHGPTGTITFQLFSTDACDTPVAGFATAGTSVDGNGTYTSAMFTTTTAGTYYWVASYSGDVNNKAVTSPCDAATESTTVTKAAPVLTTVTAHTVALGTPIKDTATLAGGHNPTGTITFSLYKTSCTNLVSSFTTTGVAVDGTGTYTSASFTPTTAGTYYWAAVYSGDASNSGATSPCGAVNESVIVRTSSPTTSGKPKLSVVKSSTPPSGSTVVRGQTVTYFLTLSNSGAAPATDITVTDKVPTGTTYKPTSATCNGLSGCSVSESNGTVTWTGITIPADTSHRISFAVVVNATDTNGEVITNHAVFTNEGTTGCTGETCTTNSVTVHVHVPTPTPPSRISQGTTSHTGEPWAGSLWAELGVLGVGFGLLAFGEWLRRRRRPDHAG